FLGFLGGRVGPAAPGRASGPEHARTSTTVEPPPGHSGFSRFEDRPRPAASARGRRVGGAPHPRLPSRRRPGPTGPGRAPRKPRKVADGPFSWFSRCEIRTPRVEHGAGNLRRAGPGVVAMGRPRRKTDPPPPASAAWGADRPGIDALFWKPD